MAKPLMWQGKEVVFKATRWEPIRYEVSLIDHGNKSAVGTIGKGSVGWWMELNDGRSISGAARGLGVARATTTLLDHFHPNGQVS
jgi:hypothetical protein